jgi:hypothetical protein
VHGSAIDIPLLERPFFTKLAIAIQVFVCRADSSGRIISTDFERGLFSKSIIQLMQDKTDRFSTSDLS